MKIEFYIPKHETIPTRLRLKVNDNYEVLYKRDPDDFAYEFEIYGMPQDNKAYADEIITSIVNTMINQSYDHGVYWRETERQFFGEFPYCGKSSYRYIVSFRIRDAG